MDPKSSRGHMTRPFEFGMQGRLESCTANRVWDANNGIVLPCPQVPADDTPRLAMDELMIHWDSWLTNTNTVSIWEHFPLVQAFILGKLMGLHMLDGRWNINSYLFISLSSRNHFL